MQHSKNPPSGDTAITALIASLQECLPGNGPNKAYDREKLKEAAEKLSIALETPGDTVQRVAYLGYCDGYLDYIDSAQPTQITVIRIANRLKLFHILAESYGPKTGKELAHIFGVDHNLLLRLLRYLVAIRTLGEDGVDSYVATNITHNLIVPSLEAGISHSFDVVAPATMALPSFLARTNYQTPTNPRDCPFQEGFKTDDLAFEYLPKHPEFLNNFNMWMTGQREGRANWLDFFPFEEQILTGFEGGDSAVMLVDIGGARGHEMKAIKEKYPHLPGKLVLQDQPNTVAQALPVPRMQAMAHDFFTPQPIKGARVYYLRNILHDWPDDKCQIILSQVATAMTEGYSKILLNELVIPDQGASLVAVQSDITMMACLAAIERSKRQWHELIDAAGLKIEKIWTDVPEAESIMEVILK